jgi:hypothetical protein
MARGWESKSVESQIESAESRAASKMPHTSPADAERVRQRDSLLLSRTRVVHDLETAQNPRYQETLRAALKHLDDKLSALK